LPGFDALGSHNCLIDKKQNGWYIFTKAKNIVKKKSKRPLKKVQFWSRSRKAKISTTGIYGIFRGLKFVPDKEIGQKGEFFNDFVYFL
jgi:hypothetical protein